MYARERQLLERIIQYCEQIAKTREFFGDDLAIFADNFVYQNACGMCIIQIGELANKISQETHVAIPSIPWPLIRGMRNMFAHDYGSMDVEQTWATIRDDIPVLKTICEHYLNGEQQ